MKNPYKRTDVFVCNYPTHARFENSVSAYHVLKVKKCHPHGCMMFKWSCALLNKGKRCVRGYHYIGRLCEGCNHYRDEKLHHQPRPLLSPEAFRAFLEEVEQFEDWLDASLDREWEVSCRIDAVKPRFRREMAGHHSQLRLDGYLLNLQDGFIGLTPFEDSFYAIISPQQQERFSFAAGDRLDFRGQFQLDRGRLIFPRIWAVEFTLRSGADSWKNSQALVARESATLFSEQPPRCLHCPDGALVDVIEKKAGRPVHRRQLYCLQGMADWQTCYLPVIERSTLVMDECPNEDRN